MTTTEEQLVVEARMAKLGEERERSRIAKSLESGEAGATPAGLALLRRAIAPMVERLKNLQEEVVNSGSKAGRFNVAVGLLGGVDPELAAYITIRTALSFASAKKSLKSTATAIADKLMSELIADKFEEINAPLLNAILRNAADRGLSPAHVEAAVRKGNAQFDVVEEPWNAKQKLHIGTKLIDVLIETTGIVEVFYRDRGLPNLKLSPKIDEWFREYNTAATLTKPLLLPMVVPPKPWTSVEGSPYYSNIASHRKLVTRTFKGHLEALKEADLDRVYRALNLIQETAWQIDIKVLETMQEAWEKGLLTEIIPAREDEPIPVAPQAVVEDVKGGEHRKAWRSKLRGIHERNASNRSKRFEFARALSIAEEYRDREAFYFPHRLDFRGRIYASTTTLSPQGADHARALLVFSKGVPLGDKGVFWMGVHGANLWGNDKVSLEERYQWACDKIADIQEVADNPFYNLWWTEADKPWAFLGWCFEWAEAWRSGHPEWFVSRIPVALDGSCNGIQHFSAMLRDEVGGAATNLIPSDKPQDIYGEVAAVAMRKLELDAANDPEKSWMASSWRQFGIDRKITKRPVMVVPYGGTFQSCMGYTRDAVNERKAQAQSIFAGDALRPAVTYLSKVVWASIGEVVIGARVAMDWLQKVSRVYSKAGLGIQWTTPSGFVVLQHYTKPKKNQVKTWFQGSMLAFRSVGEFSDILHKTKQASSLAPNFVHSMDASALTLTVLEANTMFDIKDFAMIHDSYGTHAGNIQELTFSLRRAFVLMYAIHDVLKEFHDMAFKVLPEKYHGDIPELPAKGTLDIEQVLDSPYFFA